MTDEDINIVCSSTINDYVIIFDGFDTYQTYYKNDLILSIEMDITPKAFYRNNSKDWLVPYPQFKENIENIENEDLNQLLEHIENSIPNSKTDKQKIMDTFRNLFRTLKDAYMDFSVTHKHFREAEAPIKEAFRDLLADIEGMENIFMQNLSKSMTIDEVIKQRRIPDLTQDQREIASDISYRIKQDGLLSYLANILDDIHIGEHRNIYRKILMLFNVMRGKGSYLSETTAKAEAGKSFEDEIVFNIIAPPQYIFEVNDITLASFRRYGAINEYYFDRLIVLFGDLGSKKSFMQVEDVFNVFKKLITENKYTSTVSDNKGKGWENVELNLKVNSIGAVYQTVHNSFTEDDDQLESRTIFSTPPITDDIQIMKHRFYLNYSKSKQSIARKKAERKLREFGLYLMQCMFHQEEIINPYEDIFLEYASHSKNPKREFEQQIQLFDAYCHLTIDKCEIQYMGNYWASLEQLKEYMDYVNLENALIPYEYNFLQMIIADGKKKKLTFLYDNSDITDEDGNIIKDIDLDAITTITECENKVLEVMNEKEKKKQYIRVGRLEDYYENDDTSVDIIQTKDDLNNQQIKEFARRLISEFGLRSGLSEKKIFFRNSDLRNIYGRYKAYNDVDDVPQLLQTLHKKGYIGKYEDKHKKENIYYLTPLCETITSKFETDKSFDDYAIEYINNTGGYDYY